MKTHLSKLRNRLSSCGFSLVEVVLATGIMALGVVTILGLLPHGLEMSRQTANEQAETRIVDLVVGEMQAIDWNKITPDEPQIRYFDDQGLELLQTGGDEFKMHLNYVVQVQVPVLDVKLPTNDKDVGRQVNKNLRRVIVKMISEPLPNFNFDAPTSQVPIKTFTQLVANTGLPSS